MRRKAGRLYQRGDGRWYADLRDLGGGREAMKPTNESRATRDRDVANVLVAERVKQLEQQRRSQQLQGLRRSATIGEYCGEWLDARTATDTRVKTLSRYDLAFTQLFKVMDASMRMDELNVQLVRVALRDARRLPSRKGGTLSAASLRQMVAAMRQVYESAMIDGVVPEGMNPWTRIPKGERPRPAATTTEFLEISEAAALIKAVSTLPSRQVPLRTLVMTLLYTGGRLNEVLGLEIRDVDLQRKVITFRANQWRPLKRGVERNVPLWPLLEAEIRAHMGRMGRVGSGLLFPGKDANGAEKKLWGKLYRPIRTAAGMAGIEKRVTPQTFRVTYCAARLQTLDHGAPIASFTVRKEMGHFSLDMIDKVYGRLGTVRHRSPNVEYIPLERASTDLASL